MGCLFVFVFEISSTPFTNLYFGGAHCVERFNMIFSLRCIILGVSKKASCFYGLFHFLNFANPWQETCRKCFLGVFDFFEFSNKACGRLVWLFDFFFNLDQSQKGSWWELFFFIVSFFFFVFFWILAIPEIQKRIKKNCWDVFEFGPFPERKLVGSVFFLIFLIFVNFRHGQNWKKNHQKNKKRQVVLYFGLQ